MVARVNEHAVALPTDTPVMRTPFNLAMIFWRKVYQGKFRLQVYTYMLHTWED
jgi:hypothetical protein